MNQSPDDPKIEYPVVAPHRDGYLLRFADRSPTHARAVKYTFLGITALVIAGTAFILKKPSDESKLHTLVQKPFSELSSDDIGFFLLKSGIDYTDVQEAFHIREGLPLDETGNTNLWSDLARKFDIKSPAELLRSADFRYFLKNFRTPHAIPVDEKIASDGSRYYLDLRTGVRLQVQE